MENETVITNSNEPKSGGVGTIIGAVIIILVLIIGGWYFIGNRVEKIQDQKEEVKTLEVSTGDSTEIEDIQKDLDSLDMDSLNQ